jgi:RNA polymerase sigma-70 factor (ECF subfamily)
MSPEEAFEAHRPSMTSAAYQILGSWSDAEDVVQGTWLRWSRHHGTVERPGAWLMTVAVRASIDGLRARQARREDYPGEWLPEPVSREQSPADVVAERSRLSVGVLVMMESLSPLERAVFVLRHAFDWPYDEVAEILGRTPAAVRQLDHRARRHLRARPDRFDADPERARAATERFLTACVGGSVAALMEVLAPEVVLHSDGGGEAKAPRHRIVGSEKVARFFVAVVDSVRTVSTARVIDINGRPGLLTFVHGRPASALAFDVDGDRVVALYLMATPSKLAALPRSA